MKLTDFVYGVAYRNHRYQEDEYQVSFYNDWHTYKQAVTEKEKSEGCKIVTFQFRPIDLIDKNALREL